MARTIEEIEAQIARTDQDMAAVRARWESEMLEPTGSAAQSAQQSEDCMEQSCACNQEAQEAYQQALTAADEAVVAKDEAVVAAATAVSAKEDAQSSSQSSTEAADRAQYAAMNIATAPETSLPADNVLPGGHRYLLQAIDGLDLSGVSVQQWGTCELWIDYTGGSITLGDWEWPDISVPDAFITGNRYCLALRNDGIGILASINYIRNLS